MANTTQSSFNDVTTADDAVQNESAAPPKHCEDLTAEALNRFDQSPVLKYLDPVGTDGIAAYSQLLALFGLGGMFVLAGALFAVGCEWISMSRIRPTFNERVSAEMFVGMPAIAISALVIAVSMMWSRSVLVRFAFGAIALLPGVLVFDMLRQVLPSQIQHYLLYDMLLAYFVFATLFMFLVQLALPLQVSHLRMNPGPIPRASTRNMLELTGVTAVFLGIFLYLDHGLETNVMLLGMCGLLSTIPSLLAILIFLRDGKKSPLLWLSFIAASWFPALSKVTTDCVMWFGASSIQPNAMTIIRLSIFGWTITFCTTMFACVWLRWCGWRCFR